MAEDKENLKRKEKDSNAFARVMSSFQKTASKSAASSPPPSYYSSSSSAGAALAGAVKVKGLILMVLGLLHWIFFRGTTIHSFSSAILLVLASWTFFDYMKSQGSMESSKGSWIVVAAFAIWFFLLGRDLNSIIYVFIFLGGFTLVYGIWSKGRKLGEIALGFVPLLFFFLDLGIIAYLFESLGWEPGQLALSLVLWMPWWSLLGLFCLPPENALFSILKVLGIIYLILVLIVPFVPDIGHYQPAVPGTEQFIESEQALKSKFAATENPVYSQWVCTFSEPTNVMGCVQRRQELFEIKSICLEKGYTQGTTQYNECLKEQEEAKKASAAIKGSIDQSLKEFTTAQISVPKDFPRETNEQGKIYPIVLNVNNPGGEEFMLLADCSFRKGQVAIMGRVYIDGDAKNEVKIAESSVQKRIGCQSTSLLNGSYKLEFNVTLANLQTFSYVTRIFKGTATDKTQIEKIEDDKFVSIYDNRSKSPEDLAVLVFRFGSEESDNPVIDVNKPVTLTFAVENTGAGQVERINSYDFASLIESGFSVDENKAGDKDCLQGSNLYVSKTQSQKRKPQQLRSCYLKVPLDLKNIGENPVVDTFIANINFDYKFSRTESIKVGTIPTGAIS